jgi:hypothetical protein
LIIAASKPAPAITAKRSPLKQPDVQPAAVAEQRDCTAWAMSGSMPRFVANRFDVPAGTIASGICVSSAR